MASADAAHLMTTASRTPSHMHSVFRNVTQES